MNTAEGYPLAELLTFPQFTYDSVYGDSKHSPYYQPVTEFTAQSSPMKGTPKKPPQKRRQSVMHFDC